MVESKSAESKVAEAIDPEIVLDFVDFITDEGKDSLGFCSRAFVAKHSNGFEKAEEYAEQGVGYPLQWTQIYEDYCAKLDQGLSSFCRDRDLGEQQLFDALLKMTEEKGSKSFLPIFLQLVSFENFVSEMSAHAKGANKKLG